MASRKRNTLDALDALGHEGIIHVLFPFLTGDLEVAITRHAADNRPADPCRELTLECIPSFAVFGTRGYVHVQSIQHRVGCDALGKVFG